jgi:hypothetical protein
MRVFRLRRCDDDAPRVRTFSTKKQAMRQAAGKIRAWIRSQLCLLCKHVTHLRDFYLPQPCCK